MTTTTDRKPLALPGGHTEVLLHSYCAMCAHGQGFPVITGSLGISRRKYKFHGDDALSEVV